MNEADHKKNLSEAAKRVQNSKTLRELCGNLNAYEVAHFKAREAFPDLATFQTGEFDLEKLPSFGGQFLLTTGAHFHGMKVNCLCCLQPGAYIPLRIGESLFYHRRLLIIEKSVP